MHEEILKSCEGFEWDEHNSKKNWFKHHVSTSECEQVFFNNPIISDPETVFTEKELRFYALGCSDEGRLLFIVFTIRSNLLRVISARDMSKKERKIFKAYDKTEKNS